VGHDRDWTLLQRLDRSTVCHGIQRIEALRESDLGVDALITVCEYIGKGMPIMKGDAANERKVDR
jgi:hypothetical protein